MHPLILRYWRKLLAGHSAVDQEILREQVFEQNIRRLLLFVKLAIPLNIGHILFFASRLPDAETVEYTWRIGIILSHAAIMSGSLIMWGLALLYKRDVLPGFRLAWALRAFFLFLVLAGTGISVVDQLVITAITPFLIILTITALAFLIPPLHSFILFATAYLVFFFLLPITQEDPSVLMSNRVNGVTAVGVGFFLSILLWRNFVSRLWQARIIEMQSMGLEQRNSELLRERRKLKTAISARDQFFSIIAHDLKAPFHSLLGFSEILKDEWEDLDEKEKLEIIQLIRDSSESAYQLLLNLLDWARLQKQRIELQPVPIDIRKLLDQVLDQLGSQASLKGIAFELDVSPGLEIEGDEHMITSVFRNLISNAIKFSPRNSAIEIFCRPREETILCSVRDHGLGIPSMELRRIFRLSESRAGTDNEKGTGLGLHLCREFVRKHKGKIWVKSKEGEGSTFYICFPLRNPGPKA